MSRAHTSTVLALTLLLLLAACEPVAVQSPSGLPKSPAVYPAGTPPSQPPPASPTSSAASPPPQLSPPQNQPLSPNQPQPQVSGSQRTEYVWQKMMEGVAMGGAVAGPFGAGGGLVIGLLAGLLTADAHYADLQAKIQTEQSKDRELEAQLERELERQRELDAQLGNGPTEPKADPTRSKEPNSTAEGKGELKSAQKAEPERVASLPERTRTPAPSSSRPFKNVEVRDIDGDGVPDLWVYYNPLAPEEVIRQEEATKGDGRVDVWSYFKDGKLVRREVDTGADGRPDTVYHYQQEKLVREERDEKGEGRATYRAYYENGRVARVEKSLRADGKMDLWTYYDTTKDEEVISKEERDLNGDGAVDLWSYYEGGRLVRRDVSALGLDYLSKIEKLPSGASAEPKEPLPSPALATQATAVSP